MGPLWICFIVFVIIVSNECNVINNIALLSWWRAYCCINDSLASKRRVRYGQQGKRRIHHGDDDGDGDDGCDCENVVSSVSGLYEEINIRYVT